MSESLFKEAVALVKAQPPLHGIKDDVYQAAMVVEYRQRALLAAAKGHPEPKNFVCPTCKQEMQENHILQTWECGACQRGASPSALEKRFATSGVLPPIVKPVVKPSTTIWPSTKPVDYNPRLTAPIPQNLDVKKFNELAENVIKDNEPIVMWRSWLVRLNEDGFDRRMLTSINGQMWPHNEPLRAQHIGSIHKGGDERSPSWFCNCGIYAVKTLIQAQKWGLSHENKGQIQVIGKVELSGRVLEFETGAKAEFAYPKKLWLPSRYEGKLYEMPTEQWANELAAAYNIDVEVEDGMYDLGLSHT